MRGKFEAVIRAAQDSICAAVEAEDGGRFREDAWTRADGGGGISRVLQVRRLGTITADCYAKQPRAYDRMGRGVGSARRLLRAALTTTSHAGGQMGQQSCIEISRATSRVGAERWLSDKVDAACTAVA